MKKKFVLHIGLHKTGSSSIQQYFSAPYPGITYPRFKNIVNNRSSINHSVAFFTTYSKNFQNYHVLKQYSLSPEEMVASRAGYRQQIEEFFGAVSATNHIVVSGEDISMLSKAELASLRSDISQKCPNHELVVLCFLRSPTSLFVSEVQQSIKGGFTLPQAIGRRLDGLRTNAMLKLKNLENVFGDSLSILCFEVAAKTSILQNFFKAADMMALYDSALELPWSNQSMSMEGASLLSEYNSIYPLFVDNKLSPNRKAKDVQLFTSIPGTKFRVDQSLLTTVQDLSAEYIDYVHLKHGFKFESPVLHRREASWSPETLTAIRGLIEDGEQRFGEQLLRCLRALVSRNEIPKQLVESTFPYLSDS